MFTNTTISLKLEEEEEEERKMKRLAGPERERPLPPMTRRGRC